MKVKEYEHEFYETCHSVTFHCTGQFTPKMKANANPRLLSSLVWIDSGVVVSQHRLESFFHEIRCSGMTSFMEFMIGSHCSKLSGKMIVTLVNNTHLKVTCISNSRLPGNAQKLNGLENDKIKWCKITNKKEKVLWHDIHDILWNCRCWMSQYLLYILKKNYLNPWRDQMTNGCTRIFLLGVKFS